MRHDILTARQHLNFSTLGAELAATQKAALYEAVNMIELGAMPLPRFLLLHPEAKVTPEELTTLKAFLAPGHPRQASPGTASSAVPALASLSTVRPELDGFPFHPTFENWKPISTTDRGDNNTFRFVFGNQIAINAANSGNISPWPDGATFAKVRGSRNPVPGPIFPGKFIQVELMRKDARRYTDTEGWGWGRRGD